jgi:putative pyruvate formate lyase activating enzyme
VNLTRRNLLKGAVLAGGALLFGPAAARPRGAAARSWEPGYQILEKEGILAQRADEASALLEECRLCPRACGVNRREGELGFCRSPARAVVYSAQPHFGEEVPLVGRGGSGTIFFSHCNLRCVFCQNWPIAHEGRGKEVSDEDLAGLMLRLEQIGCHNINLVTPTHVMPAILGALRVASRKGLSIPLVYNTSGYERVEILRLLDGIVDIYLPDMKYADPAMARTYSAGADDYPAAAQGAIREMHRQVGVLATDETGIARRGLIIRHLIMPNRVAGTRDVVRWVADALPQKTYVNLMAQYRVEYKAYEHPEIARGISVEEFLEAVAWADEAGLTNLDGHTLALADYYRSRRQ